MKTQLLFQLLMCLAGSWLDGQYCMAQDTRLIVPQGHSGGNFEMQFTANEEFLITYNSIAPSIIKLWESKSNRLVNEFRIPSGTDMPVAVCYFHQLKRLYYLTDKHLYGWNTATYELFLRIDQGGLSMLSNEESPILAIASDANITIIDPASGTFLRKRQLKAIDKTNNFNTKIYSDNCTSFLYRKKNIFYLLKLPDFNESVFTIENEGLDVTRPYIDFENERILFNSRATKEIYCYSLANGEILNKITHDLDLYYCSRAGKCSYLLGDIIWDVRSGNKKEINKDRFSTYDGYYVDEITSSSSYIVTRSRARIDSINCWKYRFYNPDNLQKTDSIVTKHFEGERGSRIIAGNRYIVSPLSQKYADGRILSSLPLIWRLGGSMAKGIPYFFNSLSLENVILNHFDDSDQNNTMRLERFFRGYGAFTKDTRFTLSPDKKFLLFKLNPEMGLYSLKLTEKGVDSLRLITSIRARDDDNLAITNEQFSPDGKYTTFLLGSSLYIMNTLTGKLIEKEKVKSADYKSTLNNEMLVYTSGDKTMTFFILSTGKTNRLILRAPYGNEIRQITIGKRSEIIITSNTSVQIIDTTGKVLRRFEALAFRKAAIKESRGFLVTESGNMVVVDHTTKKPIHYLIDDSSADPGLNNWLTDINYKTFGRHSYHAGELKFVVGDSKAIVCTADSTVRIWDLKRNILIKRYRSSIRVDKIVLNEREGKMILFSYGQNGGITMQKNVFTRADVYDLANGLPVFSTESEESSVKLNPPSVIKKAIETPIDVAVYGKGIEKMSVLDFSKQITYNEKFSTLCASYGNLCLVVKIEKEIKKKWYCFADAAGAKIAEDSPYLMINKYSKLELLSLIDNKSEIFFDSLSNQILGFVERNGILAIYGSKYPSNGFFAIYDLSGKQLLLKGVFPFDIVNFEEGLSPKGDYLLLEKFSNDKKVEDSISASLLDLRHGAKSVNFFRKDRPYIFTDDNGYLIFFDPSNSDSSQVVNLKNKTMSYFNLSYNSNQYLGDGWLSSGDTIINLNTNERLINGQGFYIFHNKDFFIGFDNNDYLLKDKATNSVSHIPLSIAASFTQTLPLNGIEEYVTINSENNLIRWNGLTSSINGITGSAISSFSEKQLYQNSDSTFIVSDDHSGTEYDARDLSARVSFIASASGKLSLILPDHYYFVGKGDITQYHFNHSGEIYSLQQFDLKFNRPDKVLSTLGKSNTTLIKSYYNAYLKRIKRLKIDTTSFYTGFGLPVADIKDRDKIEYQTETGNLSLHITGSDSTYLLDRFNVWVNEVPLYGIRGVSLKDRKTHSLDTTVVVRFSQGINVIESSVTNANGFESYRIPLQIDYSPVSPEKERLYFVGIGVERFRDSTHNLSWSLKDIRDLAYVLKSKYQSDIVIDTLFDQQVTISGLKALKNRLLQRTSIGDKVIIAYSGHGLLSKDYEYFLSSYDVDFDHPQNAGLPYDLLESLLDSIPARRKLMLLDACHSGEVDKEEITRYKQAQGRLDSLGVRRGTEIVYTDSSRIGMKSSFELMQELFVNVGRSTGATVISAASGIQFALERDGLENGVFTYSILEYLRSHSTCKVNELRDYVNKRVSQLTSGLQVPTTRSDILNYDWYFW